MSGGGSALFGASSLPSAWKSCVKPPPAGVVGAAGGALLKEGCGADVGVEKENPLGCCGACLSDARGSSCGAPCAFSVENICVKEPGPDFCPYAGSIGGAGCDGGAAAGSLAVPSA